MSFTNHQDRCIHGKVIVCGASGAGVKTLLQSFWKICDPQEYQQLTPPHPDLDLSFLPIDLGSISNYRIKLHAFGLSLTSWRDWMWVLWKGVDGVVFVTDPSIATWASTLEAWEQWKVFWTKVNPQGECLGAIWKNKTDLTCDKVPRSAYEAIGWPSWSQYEGSALDGHNVESFFRRFTEDLFMKLLPKNKDPVSCSQ